MRWLGGLLFLTACTVGGATGSIPGGGDDDQPDAGTVGGDGSPITPMDAPAFMCRNKVTPVGDGHHNPGQDCQGGCHNHGFKLSGTLYTTANGAAPVSGATITIKDAQGFTYEAVSQQNGNFYTSSAMTFPVTVIASMCPDVKPMAGSIAAAGGCNKTGCHTAAAAGRVHLP